LEEEEEVKVPLHKKEDEGSSTPY
jgi:hypothetical protein